jgi:hypothetical protein
MIEIHRNGDKHDMNQTQPSPVIGHNQETAQQVFDKLDSLL